MRNHIFIFPAVVTTLTESEVLPEAKILDEREDKVEEISEEELKSLKEKIDSFTNNILPACLSLLDAIPDLARNLFNLIIYPSNINSKS